MKNSEKIYKTFIIIGYFWYFAIFTHFTKIIDWNKILNVFKFIPDPILTLFCATILFMFASTQHFLKKIFEAFYDYYEKKIMEKLRKEKKITDKTYTEWLQENFTWIGDRVVRKKYKK